MQTGTKKRRFFSRQPLSAFSKIAVATFFGMIVICGIMSFFSSLDQVVFVGSMMLLSAVLILTRIRWMPLIGSVITGLFLYVFLVKEPLPIYYLVHPKDALNTASLSFTMFVIDVFFLWGIVVAFGSSCAAFIQNYWRREAGTPRWFTSAGVGLIGILLGAILLGALVPPPDTAVAASGSGIQPLLVHMESNTFMPALVTIPAGTSLVLLDGGYFHHTLSNGAWVNGQPRLEKQASAPSVDRADINGAGQSIEVGTFDTPGVYHLYCERSPGMTLTIIVR